MIASFPMYDVPELRSETDALWADIRDGIRARGLEVPETLDRTRAARVVWNDPNLVLSQTCGMPWRLGLHRHAQLVGTPDYGVEGCPPGYYCSTIVVRENDPRSCLDEFSDATCAFNAPNSQSGFAAWEQREFAAWRETGAHVLSITAVANGDADIAAIDAVTWRLALQYQSEAVKLRVLETTRPTPGLPFITSLTQDAAMLSEAIEEAIANLASTIREPLGLIGFQHIPSEEYLAV